MLHNALVLKSPLDLSCLLLHLNVMSALVWLVSLWSQLETFAHVSCSDLSSFFAQNRLFLKCFFPVSCHWQRVLCIKWGCRAWFFIVCNLLVSWCSVNYCLTKVEISNEVTVWYGTYINRVQYYLLVACWMVGSYVCPVRSFHSVKVLSGCFDHGFQDIQTWMDLMCAN